MRDIVKIAAILAIVFVSTSATAGESPLLAVEWDGSLAESWTPPGVASSDANMPADALRNLERVSAKVKNCQEFKVGWSESSARKLFRAMRYHDAELREVDLQPWVEVSVTSRKSLQPFSVHPQNEGRAVGMVPLDPTWTFTYVVVQTAKGPVVASQIWPSPKQLDNGATCRPVASRIEFPAGRATDVNIEPFRMWGMRVAETLQGETIDRPIYQAVVEVIRSTDRVISGR